MAPSREAAESRLEEISRLLERHRVLEHLAASQPTDKRDLLAQMQRRENLVEVQRHLRGLHPADLAAILGQLPTADRLLVYRQLRARDAGLTLVELDDEVRNALIDDLSAEELVRAASELDADDLAWLSDWLPEEVVRHAWRALRAAGRSRQLDTAAYPEESVGRLMRQDVVTVRGDQTVGEALNALRAEDEWPGQTDRVFVIDARHLLQGSVRLSDLIRADPAERVLASALTDVAPFRPTDPAERAAQAFERYDLVSAPVVDELGKLIGRLTIDAVVDYLRAASDQDALTQAGLRGGEDLFAPVSESVRNRWPWLAVNLLTAVVASRVIGAFEDTISRTVALAALMPIVASVGGNTGNQTVALVVRALALGQIRDSWLVARKEFVVGTANGAAWGTIVGLLAWWFYGNAALAAVMAAAVFLNLVVAAVTGVAVPLGLRWMGRDPVHGASVMLTFVTDGMGFFLFLGLAAMFLT